MKKVMVNPGCISCGMCERTAPDVFEVTDVAHVKAGVRFHDYEREIETAARECPVGVIQIIKECNEKTD